MAVEIITNIKELQEKFNFSNNLPIFATQEYADYLRESKNIRTIWFIKKVGDLITFIIPLAIKRKLIFTIGYFLTAVNNLANSNVESERQFLEDVVSLIKKNTLCDWIQQPPNWAIFNVVPSNSINCEFGSYRIDLLSNNEDELFAKVNYHHKRLINKSLRNKVIIKNNHDLLKDCAKVFKDATTHGNHTLPTTIEIEKILKYLPDNIDIYVSYAESNPQSSIICFTNKFCVYAAYIGKIADSSSGENHLLHWQAIKDAKQKGIKYFDFIGARINPVQGSKQEGIQKFKRYFGGEFIKGFLWKMPIKKFKYNFYTFLVSISYLIKGKKNKGDIIDQELKRIKK